MSICNSAQNDGFEEKNGQGVLNEAVGECSDAVRLVSAKDERQCAVLRAKMDHTQLRRMLLLASEYDTLSASTPRAQLTHRYGCFATSPIRTRRVGGRQECIAFSTLFPTTRRLLAQTSPPLVGTFDSTSDTTCQLPRAPNRSLPPSCRHSNRQKCLRRTIPPRSAPSPLTTRETSSSPPQRTKRCSSTTARLANTKNNSTPRNTASISPASPTNPPPSFMRVLKKTVSQAERVVQSDIQRPLVPRRNPLSLPSRQQLPTILQRTQKEVSLSHLNSAASLTKNRNQSDLPRNVTAGRHLPLWSD